MQALNEAYAKGISTTAVEPTELPKEVRDGVTKATPGASIRKAQRLEIKHTLQYVAFDKPQVQSYQAVLVLGNKRIRLKIGPDGKKSGSSSLPDKGESDPKAEVTIESVSQYEFRAGLQFAPLDRPRIVYQLELEKDGAMSRLNLRADGSVVPAPVRPGARNRSYLGLSLEQGSPSVSQVLKGGPAELAGIKVGDKLLMVGEVKIGALTDLLRVVQSTEPGTEVKVKLQRGEELMTIAVKLGAPPE